MNREETVALFLQCEAERVDALAAGKSEAEAHEAAKACWNCWVEPLLAERRRMESEGSWASKQSDWLERAKVDFTFCLFLNKGAATEERQKEIWADLEMKPVPIDSPSALFYGLTFPGDADFSNAVFTGTAYFATVAFAGRVIFNNATFTHASFWSTAFARDANFKHAVFAGNASFSNVAFTGTANFENVTLEGTTYFDCTTFSGNVFFNKAKFGARTDFRLATLKQAVQFDDAVFEGEADFNGVRSERAFSMAGTTFKMVPDFIQAHFEEAPRLDNMQVARPLGLDLLSERQARDICARWRALKRLATQANDTDRELEFNAREIRAELSMSHWLIPVRLLDGKKWLEAVRSCFGWLYGFFSDYGRSLFRPFLAWAIGIALFAAFYLSQTEDMRRQLELQDVSYVLAAGEAGSYALSHFVPCFALGEKPADPNQTRVDGLSEKVRSQTNARAEALNLAFRNAFVVLDGGNDASHRMYGCLYGLELYGGQDAVPIVPRAVSAASAIQKLISGVLIFLFGLALRNMLKVK